MDAGNDDGGDEGNNKEGREEGTSAGTGEKWKAPERSESPAGKQNWRENPWEATCE